MMTTTIRSTAQEQDTAQMITLGVVTSAHGVKGAVKVKCFTEHPDDILGYDPLYLDQKPVHATKLGMVKDLLLLQFEGITDRNQAETLQGMVLAIERSQLPALSDNQFYHADLIGLDVFDEDETHWGMISAVSNFGAGDILDVQLAENGEEISIPFTNDAICDIDIAQNRLVINRDASGIEQSDDEKEEEDHDD